MPSGKSSAEDSSDLGPNVFVLRPWQRFHSKLHEPMRRLLFTLCQYGALLKQDGEVPYQQQPAHVARWVEAARPEMFELLSIDSDAGAEQEDIEGGKCFTMYSATFHYTGFSVMHREDLESSIMEIITATADEDTLAWFKYYRDVESMNEVGQHPDFGRMLESSPEAVKLLQPHVLTHSHLIGCQDHRDLVATAFKLRPNDIEPNQPPYF